MGGWKVSQLTKRGLSFSSDNKFVAFKELEDDFSKETVNEEWMSAMSEIIKYLEADKLTSL